MGNLMLIFLGGGLGAVSRYGVTKLFNALFQAVALPLGTLVVNVTGSFALGLVVALVDAKALSEPARLLIGVGFIGAYTTFSTFAVESVGLARNGSYLPALWNFLLNNVLSGAAVLAGFLLVSALRPGAVLPR
jgi:CrcB protein